MALVDLLEVSKQYEYKKILEKISLHINEGERIAIVGKNGSGKSTIMKIVAGILEIDEGERLAQNNVEIAMLPQQPHFKENESVRDAIENQLAELKNYKKEFDAVNLELASDYENKELLHRSAELSAVLDHHNAWDLDNRIEEVLERFTLKEYEHRAANLLSGGEQKRVALAGLLLRKPDLLLLDEPTNHLDVYMVEFLEEMLNKLNFTLLFISHDRYFIDNIATRTVEIEEGNLRSFEGGYRSYLYQKEQLMLSLQKSHDTLLKFLKAEEEWLNRGVRARVKRNEGRKERVFKLREEAKKNPSVIRKMKLELEREQKHFNRNEGVNRQKMLFELKGVSKALGEKNLIENFSARILQKDRIGIVGKNGSGKSTFLKILLGRLALDKGEMKFGDVRIGYFDQHREMLDDAKTLIETFCPQGGDRVDVRGRNMHVFGYLKNFLFPKEFLDMKIGTLSGGEKNRVALALLFTKEYDLLILDEPTNDLDIPTINILEEYLLSFQGALLFVSHDRYFVDKLATKLFIFKGEGEVEESHKTYSEYLDIEKELREYESMAQEVESEVKIERQKSAPKKLSYKEQRLLESLPHEIAKIESRIAELKACLGNPECYHKHGIDAIAKELEALEAEYEEKGMALLELEEKAEELGNN